MTTAYGWIKNVRGPLILGRRIDTECPVHPAETLLWLSGHTSAPDHMWLILSTPVRGDTYRADLESRNSVLF